MDMSVLLALACYEYSAFNTRNRLYTARQFQIYWALRWKGLRIAIPHSIDAMSYDQELTINFT